MDSGDLALWRTKDANKQATDLRALGFRCLRIVQRQATTSGLSRSDTNRGSSSGGGGGGDEEEQLVHHIDLEKTFENRQVKIR